AAAPTQSNSLSGTDLQLPYAPLERFEVVSGRLQVQIAISNLMNFHLVFTWFRDLFFILWSVFSTVSYLQMG
ncbi:MAG: hypothetical protein ACKPKO_33870, partial [Candidatus Fonsibacter sp.]